MKIKIKGLNFTKNEMSELNNFFEVIHNLNKNLNYELNICNENMKEFIHNKYLNTKFKKKNSYRGFTLPSNKIIFVYYNKGENLESLKWIIIHELTHANLRENIFLKSILSLNLRNTMHKYNISSQQEYEKMLGNDNFHEDMLEEQICNEFATNFIGENYDRIWWRNQIKNVA